MGDTQWVDEIRDWIKHTEAAIPGFTRRTSQDRMINAVAKVMQGNGGRLVAVEAPTGVGKSVGYFLPGLCQSLRSGRTLVVATATVAP